MEYKEVQKQLDAAMRILNEDVTTPDKIRSLSALIRGINPKLDATLKEVTHAFSTLEKLEKFEIIELTAEAIPEATEKNKKRKKALLLLFRFWHDLKGEVKRVEKEFKEVCEHGGDKAAQTRGPRNIVGAAKEPLGIVTLAAVGLVVLSAVGIPVTITNKDCQPITPVTNVPINIPGLQLPSQPIPSGGSATAVLPPVTLTVDGSQPDQITLSGFKQQYTFYLRSRGIDIIYNSRSLLGAQTEVKLSKDTSQKVVIRC